jgi:hypothetical protein
MNHYLKTYKKLPMKHYTSGEHFQEFLRAVGAFMGVHGRNILRSALS